MNILIISNHAPYDTVGAAGEKTHNFYLKTLASNKDYKVNLITVCSSDDYRKLDYDAYGIDNEVFIESQGSFSVLKRQILRSFGYIVNHKDKYANFVSLERKKFFLKCLYSLKKDGYVPDCIILEFTHCILLIEDVKKFYPNVPVIGSSHDVSYKGSERVYNYEKNMIKKFFRKRQYENLKMREVQALSLLDCIVPQNENDINILKKNDSLKTKRFLRIVPYYDSYADIKRHPDGRTIIFYGSMSRKENYLSVIDFIENVFNYLTTDKRLVVIGGNPPECLKKYKSNKIFVTGFLPLKEVKEYFSSCECMVVPLLLGSGIKVKILEALSGAVPVVTNDIGNEGIFAENGKQIILCANNSEFIDFLDNKKITSAALQQIGENGKNYVLHNFNLKKSQENYLALVHDVCNMQ